MKETIPDLALHTLLNPKLAATVGSSTALVSAFDIFKGGIGTIAVAAGTILSVSLIIIHWMRWLNDKREDAIRLDMDVQKNKKELEHFTLENKVLKLELKKLQEK